MGQLCDQGRQPGHGQEGQAGDKRQRHDDGKHGTHRDLQSTLLYRWGCAGPRCTGPGLTKKGAPEGSPSWLVYTPEEVYTLRTILLYPVTPCLSTLVARLLR